MKNGKNPYTIPIVLIMIPIAFFASQARQDRIKKQSRSLDGRAISILKRNLEDCYDQLGIAYQKPNIKPENSSNQIKTIFAGDLRACKERFKNEKGVSWEKKKSKPMTPEDWKRTQKIIDDLNKSNIKLK